MRIILYWLLAIVAGVSPAVAGVNDPVMDAAWNVVENQREADVNFDYWNPNIYLFRFNLDVTGDGNPELFLGSSSMVDRSPVSWSVYTSTSSGETMRVAENLLLYPGGFYLEQAGGMSRLSSVFSGPSHVTIREYRFLSGGRIQAEVQEFNGEDARRMMGGEDWRDALGLGRRVEDLEIEKVLLAEYLNNSAVKWRKYDRSHAPESQNLAENETPFLKKAEGFSAERAVQLTATEGIADPSAQGEPRSTPTSVMPSQAAVIESTPQPTTTPTHATSQTESSPDLTIVPVAIVVALISGIVIYIFRRKSK